jgi:hypothetical protein
MFNGLKIKTNSINLLSLVGGATIAAATLALTAGNASAGTLTFNLDSTIIGGNVGSSINYGTVKLDDSNISGNNGIDVTVNLSQAWKPLSLYLNYGGSSTIASSTTAIAPYPSKSVGFALNNKKVQGSGNYGNFDLEIPNGGNLGNFTSTWKTTLKASSGSLSLTDFDFKDSQGKLYAALHIGNNGLNTLPGGVGSIAIGASTKPGTGTGPGGGQAVPEPLTILGAATAAGFGAGASHFCNEHKYLVEK